MSKEDHARLMYARNKAYVEDNLDTLSSFECIAFCRQQDALYLKIQGYEEARLK